jgi:membrane associated rhomboid family serine protease
VGSHCPDCIKSGGTQRVVHPFRQGTLADAPVTKGLIIVNVAVYLLQYASIQHGKLSNITNRFAMWPIGVALGHQWYRLVTAAFLHASILHIGFNMFALYLFGPTVERASGKARFLSIYILSALGGSALSFLLGPPNVPSVGASGAIFGVLGAAYVLGRKSGGDVSGIAGLIIVNIVIGFTVPNIDWRAHLGGLLVGAATTWLMASTPRGSSRRVLQAGVVVLMFLAIAAVVAYRASTFPGVSA